MTQVVETSGFLWQGITGLIKSMSNEALTVTKNLPVSLLRFASEERYAFTKNESVYSSSSPRLMGNFQTAARGTVGLIRVLETNFAENSTKE